MTMTWRDMFATLLVAIGVILFAAWLFGIAIAGMTTVAAVAIGVLVLGIAASASAVVPGFGEMLRGSRVYLVGTSLLGVLALVAGLYAIASGDSVALTILVAATVILWLVSTARHVGLLHVEGGLGHA